MKPVMYIVANKGLGMSPGKLAAQVAHAAVEAYRRTPSVTLQEWYKQGHAKVILEARDTEHLLAFERFAKEKAPGAESVLIIDEGRTEIDAHTPTALGFIVVDKEQELIQGVFADLRTYRETNKAKKDDKSLLSFYKGLRSANVSRRR